MKLAIPLKVAVSLALLAVSVIVVGFVSVAVQQNYRQSANDPQIQMAEDTAAALNRGADPKSVLPAGPVVDLSASLAPFVIITDNNLKVLASSGQLNGRAVLPPSGAFTNGNRVTWQPATGVREAAVIAHYHGGYVVAARSLREVEIREQLLTNSTSAALVAVVVVCLVLLLIVK